MRDDFIDEKEIIEEEYEIDEELEPEMQGFMQGWKEAGNYTKEDKSDLFSDDEEE